MRKLTFKGYLMQQLQELSDCDSRSLYRYARLSRNNARLKDVFVLYLSCCTEKNLCDRLLKGFPYLAADVRRVTGVPREAFGDELSEYRTVYENYLTVQNTVAKENQIKTMMFQRIIVLKNEKRISNYRIYHDLGLNHGNANAFLKYGDVSKMSLKNVRSVLAYVDQYPNIA